MKNTEIWRDLIYYDVRPDMYSISSYGRIRNKYTGKFLTGNNPNNEKQYVRVCLQRVNNKQGKKYPLHRMVLGVFTKIIDCYEVNHKDGNKKNNKLENLEYLDRLGNAYHAKVNNLYKSCEDHHNATLSNYEVHQICQWMQDGKSNIEIISLLDLDIVRYMNILSKIRHRKSWTNISKKYKWDDGLVYKKYTKDDIYLMCKYIHIDNISIKETVQIFPQYPDKKKLRNVLKKIKQKKLYKSIIFSLECSTTRERLL